MKLKRIYKIYLKINNFLQVKKKENKIKAHLYKNKK